MWKRGLQTLRTSINSHLNLKDNSELNALIQFILFLFYLYNHSNSCLKAIYIVRWRPFNNTEKLPSASPIFFWLDESYSPELH